MAAKQKVEQTAEETFLSQAKPANGEAKTLLEKQAKELTKQSAEGSEDFGGNVEYAPNGFVEVGERVYHQDIDPRRHLWNSPVQEPIDVVVFNQVPRTEPKPAVQAAQDEPEQDTGGDKG